VRRGLYWSGASSFLSCLQVFDDCCGCYWAQLVEWVRALEAVDDAVSGSEARGQGASSGVLARGWSPLLSGIHGGDMDASGTVLTLCYSRRGWHGEGQWCRGVLLDTLGWLGALCGDRREEGERKGCSALYGSNGVVVWGTGNTEACSGGEREVAGDKGGGQGWLVLWCAV